MSKYYSKLTQEQKEARRKYYKEYHNRPDRIQKKREKAVSDQKKRREKIKAMILEAKNRPCTDCKIQLPPEIMDLDHVRGEKKITLSKATRAGGYLSWEELAEEIAKCDPRCPNCHRLRHYNEFKLTGHWY